MNKMKNAMMFEKMKAPFLFIIMVMIIQSGYGMGNSLEQGNNSNSCKISLKSLTGSSRNLKDLKAIYVLEVQNKGNVAETVLLNIKDGNLNCKNPDHSDNEKNIVLEYELLDETTQQPVSDKIIVNPGGSYKFLLKAVVSEDAPVRTWSCAIVEAAVPDCMGKTVGVVLYTYNPHPSPEGEY